MIPLVPLLLFAALPLKVVLAEPDDMELRRRIENQIGDLVIDITRVSETTRSSTRTIARAERLAKRAGGAEVVALVERRARDTFVLHVADLRTGTVMTRVVNGPKRSRSRLGGSAARESVALAIRSSLQALSVGGATDSTPTEELEPEDGSGVAEVEPVDTSSVGEPIERPPSVEAEKDSTRPLFWGSASWRVHVLGRELPVTHGLLLGAGLELGERFEIGLEGEFAWPAVLRDESTEVRIARHGALAVFGIRLLSNRPVSLATALSLGTIVYRRRTTALDSSVAAAPSALRGGLTGGAQLAARMRLVSHLELELAAGLDVLPSAPVLAYRSGEDVSVRARLWIVQPRFAVGVFFSDL